jgi:RNA recognition motif-containing protein
MGFQKDQAMSKRLYVGNLAYGVNEQKLEELFSQWGATGVTLPMDDGGRSKGFGFVDIPDDAQASAAIQAMDGKDVEGRTINVSEARPRADRGGGGGGRGGGYGGGGGGGRGGGYGGGGRGGRW